ncbi:MAG: DUF885 domain-containing protein [Chthoniobacterales bacterium]
MKKTNLFVAFALLAAGAHSAIAQVTPQPRPDISNKALITTAPPNLTAAKSAGAAALHKLANEFYDWRNEEFPVGSSDAGLHTWDDRLTDYAPARIAARAEHVRALLARVNAMQTATWSKDEKIDWILFRSQLESFAFDDRVWHSTSRDPQTYVGECSNAIFSILKKDYDTPQDRARAATARLRAMPAMLAQGEKNLQKPVKLFAQLAIASARAIDPLFNDTLMTLAKDLSPNERIDLTRARDTALSAIHDFADRLEKRLPEMMAFAPMGEKNYNDYLHRILLLPLDAAEVEMIGRVELAQYRAYEAWLPDPSLADPDPKRSKNIPPDQASFLKAYQSREAEMIQFLKDHRLVTLPDYLGKFEIRQLPEAFKPTSPGGFMNPPGLYDKDPTGFYFIPTYNPDSKNFYIRAAIEDPRPILGHEGIPGHFLQLSIAKHLSDEIRRQHQDNVFVEGWALYGEEMLMREGLYPPDSASQGQVLRLARYRSARIGVDVNLHTGKWTFEQAVKYFMEAGGLDREAAEGEAAGAASNPTQKISYIIGKWQIMQLLGRYRDKLGPNFRLGEFHDDLISHGSLPVSVLEWIMLDDPTDVETALRHSHR